MNALMRAVAAVRRAVEARRTPRRRLVTADDLTPGMTVLVECIVMDEPDDAPAPGYHVYVRPIHWNVGDQRMWFWRDKLASRPHPWIEVTGG